VRRTWKPEEEKQLIEEFKKEGCRREAIPKLARIFNRSPNAVLIKLQRLGLNVVAARWGVTTTFNALQELPSLEEVLRIVAGALKKASEPGLGQVELQRLNTIATLYKAYESGLEKYVNYRAIEEKLRELEDKYAKLVEKQKAEGHASQPDSSHLVQAPA
jgi:hypothetical protein